MTYIEPPPLELDGARVLAFARVDDEVFYTGQITMHVNGKLLGPAPRLVIAHNLHEPYDYLVFYCNSDWTVQGAAGYDSLSQAQEQAEVAFAGVSEKWQYVA